jgi:hypothetical protein
MPTQKCLHIPFQQMRLLGNFSNAIEVERELLSIPVVKSLNKLIVFGNLASARAQEILMMV